MGAGPRVDLRLIGVFLALSGYRQWVTRRRGLVWFQDAGRIPLRNPSLTPVEQAGGRMAAVAELLRRGRERETAGLWRSSERLVRHLAFYSRTSSRAVSTWNVGLLPARAGRPAPVARTAMNALPYCLSPPREGVPAEGSCWDTCAFPPLLELHLGPARWNKGS